MAQIELEIAPEHQEVLTGEPINVTLSLTNRGPDDVPVPAEHDTPPWEFKLADEQGNTRYRISARRYMNATNEDVLRPMPPTLQPLSPMAMLDYDVDLMSWSVKPIAAGRYQLTATYTMQAETVQSPAVPLTVVAPCVSDYKVLGSPTSNTMASLFIHVNSDGSEVLFQRESDSGFPAIGTAYRRSEIPADKKISSISPACVQGRWRGARWLGWIQDGALHALMGGGTEIFARMDPIPVPLTDPFLVTPVFHYFEGHGVFLVCGLQNGKPQLQEITLKSKQEPQIRTFDLPSRLPPATRAQYEYSDHQAMATLLWTESSRGKHHLKSFRVPAQGEAVLAEARLLLAVDVPVLAFDASPMVTSHETVDVLLDAQKQGDPYIYKRIGLQDETVLGEWKLPQAELGKDETPSEWAILASDAPSVLVCLATNRRVLYLDAAMGETWNSLASSEGAVRFLTLAALDKGGLWATWIRSSAGIEYVKIK